MSTKSNSGGSSNTDPLEDVPKLGLGTRREVRRRASHRTRGAARAMLLSSLAVVLVAGSLSACTNQPGPGGTTTTVAPTTTVPPASGDGRDLGVVADSLPASFAPGRANDFSVAVTNFGDHAATGSTLTITGPIQLTADGAVGGVTCDSSNDGNATSALTCDLGSIAPDETVTVEVTVWAGDWSGERDVTYSAASDGNEPSPDAHTNSVTVATSIATPPETIPTVEITSPDTTATLSDSDTITYSATASDETDGDLSSQIEWSYRPADDPDATQTTIATGSSGTFGPIPAGSYVLSATVTNSTDHTSTDTVTITVTESPVTPVDYDLGVVIANPPGPIPGETSVTFPITVHNFGTMTSKRAELAISATGSFTAVLDYGGGQPTRAVDQFWALLPGASRTVRARVTATGPAATGTVSISLSYAITQVGQPAYTEQQPDRHPNVVTFDVDTGTVDPSAPTLDVTAPATAPVSPATHLITTSNLSTPYAATATDAQDGDLSSQVNWTLRPLQDPNAAASPLGTGASGTLGPLDPGIYLLKATVTDSDGHTAASTIVVTSLPSNAACQVNPVFNPVSGLYLEQNLVVDSGRSYDTCGRRLQFTWNSVYAAVSEADRLTFNSTMNNDDHSMTRGVFHLYAPDEWIINLVVCAPPAGDLPQQCPAQVSRDYASADPGF